MYRHDFWVSGSSRLIALGASSLQIIDSARSQLERNVSGGAVLCDGDGYGQSGEIRLEWVFDLAPTIYSSTSLILQGHTA
jgi:hypothetical protein